MAGIDADVSPILFDRHAHMTTFMSTDPVRRASAIPGARIPSTAPSPAAAGIDDVTVSSHGRTADMMPLTMYSGSMRGVGGVNATGPMVYVRRSARLNFPLPPAASPSGEVASGVRVPLSLPTSNTENAYLLIDMGSN